MKVNPSDRVGVSHSFIQPNIKRCCSGLVLEKKTYLDGLLQTNILKNGEKCQLLDINIYVVFKDKYIDR